MSIKDLKISDYCVLNLDPHARLSEFERMTLLGSSSLDRALQWFSKTLTSLPVAKLLPSVNLEQVKNTSAIVENTLSPLRDGIFAKPDRVPSGLIETQVHGGDWGKVSDIAFDGSFDERVKDFYPYDGPSRVHARLWKTNVENAPTMIAVHGWSMGDQRINSLAFLPGIFVQHGINVALLELPFHGRRKHAEANSGITFPSCDLATTYLGIAHAVSDIRDLVLALEGQGLSRFGMAGVSLGAYIGGLWASLDKLDFGICLVPLASMSDVAWRLLVGSVGAEELASSGIKRSQLRQALRDHSPLFRSAATAQEDILVIGGRGDRVLPSSQIRMLKRHWPKAQYMWCNGGHGAHCRDARSLDTILEFLKDRGVLSGEATHVQKR